MPYVFHDRQSVPKWMPRGNTVTTAVYEGACVGRWGVLMCAHAHEQGCLGVSVNCVCGTQWHFPQSAHFNDFIDMNVFLLTDHILVSI